LQSSRAGYVSGDAGNTRHSPFRRFTISGIFLGLDDFFNTRSSNEPLFSQEVAGYSGLPFDMEFRTLHDHPQKQKAPTIKFVRASFFFRRVSAPF